MKTIEDLINLLEFKSQDLLAVYLKSNIANLNKLKQKFPNYYFNEERFSRIISNEILKDAELKKITDYEGVIEKEINENFPKIKAYLKFDKEHITRFGFEIVYFGNKTKQAPWESLKNKKEIKNFFEKKEFVEIFDKILNWAKKRYSWSDTIKAINEETNLEYYANKNFGLVEFKSPNANASWRIELKVEEKNLGPIKVNGELIYNLSH